MVVEEGKMLLQEISQVLTNLGNIYASQEEHILTFIRNIYSSHKGIETQKFHEQQANLVFFPYSPWRYGKEIEYVWTTSNEDKILEH
jgi:hypothetical protein